MYKIYWNGSPVGNAAIYKEGMYYRFCCYLHLPEAGAYRVSVTAGRNTYDLGICVPEGSVYSCVARMPYKRFSSDNFSFAVTVGVGRITAPVITGKNFEHLDKLSAARLRYTNGQPEIVIDPIQDQQDSDPNQKHQHRWEMQ